MQLIPLGADTLKRVLQLADRANPCNLQVARVALTNWQHSRGTPSGEWNCHPICSARRRYVFSAERSTL